MKVFIVEDSDFFKNWIKDQVRSVPGTEITGIADSVKSAVQGIITTKPDVLILDLRLKDGNGVDVLRKIRETRDHLKIIVFTNYPWQVFQQQCEELGADFFFDKSNTFGKLRETIVQLSTGDPAPDVRANPILLL